MRNFVLKNAIFFFSAENAFNTFQSVAASLSGSGYDFYHPPRRNKSMITPVHRFQTVDCRNVNRPNVHRPNVHRSNHHHHHHVQGEGFHSTKPIEGLNYQNNFILMYSFVEKLSIAQNISIIRHCTRVMKFRHTLR